MSREEEIHGKAWEAILEAVAGHSVGIVAGSGNRAGQELGTGIAISFIGRTFILTADHVIGDTATDEIRFFPRPEGLLNHANRSQISDLKRIAIEGLDTYLQFDILDRVRAEVLDLALLVVRGEEIEKKTTIHFFDLSQESITPPPGQFTVSFGYPSDIAKQLEGGNFVAFTSVDASRIIDHETLPSYDPECHFLRNFDLREIDPKAEPHGFSGSGVWYRSGPTPDGELWVPRLQLAGLITHHYKVRKVLKAVRVEAVIKLLQAALR
jgi:hypothetical protein